MARYYNSINIELLIKIIEMDRIEETPETFKQPGPVSLQLLVNVVRFIFPSVITHVYRLAVCRLLCKLTHCSGSEVIVFGNIIAPRALNGGGS